MEGRNATQKPMQISQRVMEGRMPSPNPTREHRGLCLAAIEAAESNSRALTEACVWPWSKQPPDDEVRCNSCAVLLV